MRRIVVLLAVLALIPAVASAATINITTSGSTVYTAAMTGFATHGNHMGGMAITKTIGANSVTGDDRPD